jgi:TIR domain
MRHAGALYGDQVFISYNHASKATVLRLRDRLKAAGFRVWVDEEGVCTLRYVTLYTSLFQPQWVSRAQTKRFKQ